MGTLTLYIQEAMRRATYSIIEDDEPFLGEIPELKGVFATGKTLEGCRSNLQSVLEGWLILALERGMEIPPLGKLRVNYGSPKARKTA